MTPNALQPSKCEKAKNSGAVEEFLNVIGASSAASVKPIHKTNPHSVNGGLQKPLLKHTLRFSLGRSLWPLLQCQELVKYGI